MAATIKLTHYRSGSASFAIVMTFLATISVSGFASRLTKECFCGRQLSPKYLNGF